MCRRNRALHKAQYGYQRPNTHVVDSYQTQVRVPFSDDKAHNGSNFRLRVNCARVPRDGGPPERQRRVKRAATSEVWRDASGATNGKAIKLIARIGDHGDDRSGRRATKPAKFEADGLPCCAAFIVAENAADYRKFELMIQLTSG